MKEVKKKVVKTTEKAFITLAEIFSTVACWGRGYEPKMPENLKK